MHKKKIQTLIAAGVLSVGIIGGTLAWFTSQDSLTNIFNTGSVTDPTNPDAGIDIEENFVGPDGTVVEPDENGNAIYPKPVLPGDKFTKEVSVTSTATYDQFLRAKITKVWKLGVEQTTADGGPALTKGAKVTHYKVTDTGKVIYNNSGGTGWTELDYTKISLTLADSGTSKGDSWSEAKGGVTDPEQGYYYYNDILKGSETTGGPTKTSDLLKSVTFVAGESTVDNLYKNLTFDVKVDAEGIQATNNAAGDSGWDKTVPAAGIEGYKEKSTPAQP